MTLRRTVAGITFENPLLLVSGTAGFGREVAGVMNLRRVGGLVTKAVSLAPRVGNRAPRVAEIHGGMLNSIGLANPGATSVRDAELPWLSNNFPSLPVLVNVVGFVPDEYARVIETLDSLPGHAGYELNLSCPNTSAGGVEFGADVASVTEVVASCRRATVRPIFAKLSPALPNIPRLAEAAVNAGATGVSLLNTMPATAYHGAEPRLGNGFGGMSGPALRPVALLAVQRTVAALPGVPIFAVGGVSRAEHVLDYLRAGASLVGIGTAALANPRVPEKILAELEQIDG